MSILDIRVTIFPDHEIRWPQSHPSLAQVLTALKEPRQNIIEILTRCRLEPDKKKRKPIKAELPVIVFTAEMAHRKAGDHLDKVIRHTTLACLDFDGVWDLDETRASLATDKHVLAYFASPSNEGLKVLCLTEGNNEAMWPATWDAMRDYFRDRHEIRADETCKDIYHLCYASYDPYLFVAEDLDGVIPFVSTGAASAKPRRVTTGNDVLADFTDPNKAMLPLHALSPDLPYGQWIEVGQALHCQFGGGDAGFNLWNTWSQAGSKYQGSEDLDKHYRSFNGYGVTFRTLLMHALASGWNFPGRPKATAPVQDSKPEPLKDFLRDQITGKYALTAWPFPCLTEKSFSLLPGSITLLCGAAGGGKSWWLLMCLRYWVRNGVKAAVLMLECTKEWHLNRLLAHMCGNADMLDPMWARINPDLSLSLYEKHKAEIETISRALWCESHLTMAACAEWLEQRCAEGYRVIAIDPITLAAPGNEKVWDADRHFMARAGKAIESSGSSLCLTSHPRKMSGGQKPSNTMDDMAGGAAYSRAAASVLWLCGIETPESRMVIDSDGYTRESIPTKVIRVLKARNCAGQYAEICYRFQDLAFIEDGCTMKDAKQPTNGKGKPRFERMQSKPADGEDPYA